MTKPHASVFAQYLERSGHPLPGYVSRGLLLSTALALAACSSTPLPEWPASPGTSSTATKTPAGQSAQATPSGPARIEVTPVAPNTALQALPYSAAIAALFPEPPTHYQTPGLAEGRQQFTTDAELSQWLLQLARQSEGGPTRLGILESGNAQSGAPIYALVATQAPAITPAAVDNTLRPTVMIVAGQQGTDAVATEAALVIAQELAPGGNLAPLLAQINVIIVPRANPDGFNQRRSTTNDGTDLRFDHLLLQTPEARFLAKLAREYRPNVLLDAGEFAAIEPTLQRFGAVRANDIGLQYAVTPNAHEFVTKAAREWMHAPTAQALDQAGLHVDWTFEPQAQQPDAVSMGTLQPTTLSNASSLKNVISLQASSRGNDLGRTHVQRRVFSLVQAMTSVLQSTAAHAGNLRKVQEFVARDVASHACRSTLTVDAQPRMEQHDIPLIDASTAQAVQKTVNWANTLHPTQPRIRSQACGYWLSANAVQAAERLAMQGLNVQRVAEPSSVTAETYQNAPQADGVTLRPETLQVVPGSFYISMNQPLAFLAAAALEPDTAYSFYRQGLLPQLADSARVLGAPSIVFEEE